MGVYDTVGEDWIQIKCVPRSSMKHYNIGDIIPLDDSLYLCPDGWFVVKNSKVLCTGDRNTVVDKWGNLLDLEKTININNPISLVLEEIK